MKEKVYACIVKDNRLLIFRHTHFPFEWHSSDGSPIPIKFEFF
jgi:hypothetical protein